MRKPIVLASVLAAAALLAPAAAQAEVTSVFGGDVACATQADGVRFCGSTTPRSTTAAFDGVPLDVNVALPPASVGGDGPYPTIMIFHGYGQQKYGLSAFRPWLDRGYATVSLTARGFGESCGTTASRAASPAACEKGYIRLLDTRYEVRDAQDLAGRLADEGIVDPVRIGVTGGSYGGGMSMALAALKDRKMLPDDTLVPWTSPSGKPMKIAAAAPEIPWSDLGAALAPNGSGLDYIADSAYTLGRPGVLKDSWEGLLFAVSSAFYLSPETGAGSDPDANLRRWNALLRAGEPYDGRPEADDIIDEMSRHHSSYGIPTTQAPAPLLISNGWTDDLFPVDEGVRFYNRTRTLFPDSPIALYESTIGHMRGQNRGTDIARIAARERAWMDYYVKGEGSAPANGVDALATVCPISAPSEGPYNAPDWAHLAPGEIRTSSAAEQVVAPDGGDPAVSRAFDPISGPGACASAPGAVETGSADYALPPAPAGGYLVLGSPTVVADIGAGPTSHLAARLVDVAPGGTKQLIARQTLRPKLSAEPVRQVFQLHPAAWRVAEGHVARLELLPDDAPYDRPSDGQAPVRVRNLELRVPVRDAPGSLGGLVQSPAGKVLPTGTALARDFDVNDVDTTIVEGPSAGNTDRTVRFTFAGRSAASYECSVDGASFAACSGPGAAHIAAVDYGTHTFAVRAVDDVGKADPTPASRTFIAAVPPSIPISGVVPQARRVIRGLGLTFDRRTDRTAPFAFSIGGRVALPQGIDITACGGNVTFRVRRSGGKSVSLRTAKVGESCRFRVRLKYSAKTLGRRGRITITASYRGNRVLLPRTLKAITLRYGR